MSLKERNVQSDDFDDDGQFERAIPCLIKNTFLTVIGKTYCYASIQPCYGREDLKTNNRRLHHLIQ